MDPALLCESRALPQLNMHCIQLPALLCCNADDRMSDYNYRSTSSACLHSPTITARLLLDPEDGVRHLAEETSRVLLLLLEGIERVARRR